MQKAAEFRVKLVIVEHLVSDEGFAQVPAVGCNAGHFSGPEEEVKFEPHLITTIRRTADLHGTKVILNLYMPTTPDPQLDAPQKASPDRVAAGTTAPKEIHVRLHTQANQLPGPYEDETIVESVCASCDTANYTVRECRYALNGFEEGCANCSQGTHDTQHCRILLPMSINDNHDLLWDWYVVQRVQVGNLLSLSADTFDWEKEPARYPNQAYPMPLHQGRQWFRKMQERHSEEFWKIIETTRDMGETSVHTSKQDLADKLEWARARLPK